MIHFKDATDYESTQRLHNFVLLLLAARGLLQLLLVLIECGLLLVIVVVRYILSHWPLLQRRK